MAVRKTVARLIADVFSGKLHPRIAAGLSPLLSLQLRAIETTELARRVAELEKRLAETEPATGLDGAGFPARESTKPYRFLHGYSSNE
jgi:hypothetical protein